MQVASYFASLSFKVDNRELRKVDNFLKKIEYKLSKATKTKLKIDFTNFGVDQKKLNLTLGNALDKASNSVVFEISKFVVNQAAMQSAIARASRNMIYPNGSSGRSGNTIIHNRVLGNAEWDRREAEKQRLWWERRNALREDEARRAAERASRPRGSSFSSNSSTIFGAGGTAGLAARMYTPALTLGLGGYGLGAINRQNQEVISAQLTTQAVTEAAGLRGQGPAAFAWLQSQGNRIGFNYMDQAESYNNFLSNALGAGMSLEGSQGIYLGFAEYSRAMGISPARNKLVMNALSQMMGKGTVSMEELKRQMAESMPGTMDVFAQAYAQMTGSGLQGSDALSALYEAIPKGKIKSAELLPFVQQILRQRAAPKLDIAMKTSQAEQARFQNMLTEQSIRASGAGVESGFARLFKSLTIAMKEASPIVESMAKSFDEISKYVSFGLLLPQSIKRAFEGRDSWFGDTYGPETVNNLKSFVEGMGQIFDELKKIAATVAEGWSLLLPSLISIANKIKDVFLYTLKMFNAMLPGGEGMDAAANYGRAMQASMSGKSPEEVAAIAAGKDFVPNVKDPFNMAFNAATNYQNLDSISGGNPLEILARYNLKGDYREEYRLARQAEVKNKSSIYYNDPKGFDQMIADRMKAASLDSEYYANKAKASTTNSYQISVNIDPATLGNIDVKAQGEQLGQWFVSEIQKTQASFPQKE